VAAPKLTAASAKPPAKKKRRTTKKKKTTTVEQKMAAAAASSRSPMMAGLGSDDVAWLDYIERGAMMPGVASPEDDAHDLLAQQVYRLADRHHQLAAVHDLDAGRLSPLGNLSLFSAAAMPSADLSQQERLRLATYF
jgi:hypothetical protein